MGIPIERPSGGGLRAETSIYASEIQAVIRGFDTDPSPKCILAELLFGNGNIDIETGIRNDNAIVVARVHSINSVTKGRG